MFVLLYLLYYFYYSYLLGVGIDDDDDDGISSYVDVYRSVGIAVGSGPGSILFD